MTRFVLYAQYILGIYCSDKVYAYEVDGLGNSRHDFDDANVPSLLAIPVLGYKYYDKLIYENTRRRLLRCVCRTCHRLRDMTHSFITIKRCAS